MLCSRLDLPGGIERAIVNTANLFVEKGHPVSLIVLDETGNSYYPLHASVKVIQQPLSFGITPDGNIISRKIKLLSDVLKLRKLLKQLKADIVIATEYPFAVAAVLSGAKKYAKLFSWEHHHFAWIRKNRFWATLSEMAYKRLNKIICLNKTEALHFEKFAATVVIPNFIENKTGRLSSLQNKQVLSVGWLIHRKGIDLMLKAAKEVLTINPTWTWKLIGEGEMLQDVLDFIQQENLQDRFILQPPAGADLSSEYLQSSLFVLSSRFEAFPMVLLEAMSFGLPCISFDCPTGPADIIADKINGLLVEKENPDKLAQAVSSLIKDEERIRSMGQKAMENIQQFSPEKIYELWTSSFK